HQLKDLYTAESQRAKALPEMEKNAASSKLKKAFASHLKETEGHVERLEKIADELGCKPSGEKSTGMDGLSNDAKPSVKEEVDENVMAAGLIAEAQRIEHYEISGYGIAVRFAQELGYDKIADQLQKTLDEEYHADDLLTDLAESRLNKKAKEKTTA